VKGLVFTYLLTYGGAAVSLFRPFHGLLVYICFAIIKPDALWSFSVPPGNYSRIVFIALFLGWVFAGLGTWSFGRAAASAAALVFYLVWSALSATQAPDQTLAWSIVWENAKIVLPVIVGLTLIDSVARLKEIVWTIVVSLGYLAYEFNVSYYFGDNRLVTVGFAGMDDKTVAITMVVGAAMALFLAVSSVRLVPKTLAVGLALFMIHVPLFSFSRGGMLGLIATGGMAFVMIPKKPLHLALLAVVVVAGLRLSGPEVRDFFLTSFAEAEERDASAQSRLELWGQAAETMARRPVFGVGPRHWSQWAQLEYEWAGPKEVHNTWLQTGAELGVPGVGALALFFLLTVVRLWGLVRRRVLGPLENTYARMVVASLAGFAVSSQFITVYGVEVPYFVTLVGAGLLKLSSAAREPVPVRSAVWGEADRAGQRAAVTR
jgi:O-antigen ligase